MQWKLDASQTLGTKKLATEMECGCPNTKRDQEKGGGKGREREEEKPRPEEQRGEPRDQPAEKEKEKRDRDKETEKETSFYTPARRYFPARGRLVTRRPTLRQYRRRRGNVASAAQEIPCWAS